MSWKIGYWAVPYVARNIDKLMSWFTRRLPATALILSTILWLPILSATTVQAADRSLYLYYTHTQETARITFRRNGSYDRGGLRELNQFLRDWRRGEPTDMDPALFDLIWQVYQDVNATGPIHIVSAYRSPQTNEMLRSRSSAVARNSRHTMGMAMDFFIPGVPIARLREAAMRRQVGGVGYYPTSGSPFVHLDTGNVRAWPRMTRAQLTRLFPDGRTLHLPSDGSVLSSTGRAYASAEWQRCRSIPCVDNQANTAPNGGGNIFDRFFGGDDSSESTTRVATNNSPTQRQVQSVAIQAPAPAPRAAVLDFRDPTEAPIPARMSTEMQLATRGSHGFEAPAAIITQREIIAQDLPNIVPIATTLDPIIVASINPQTFADPQASLGLQPLDTQARPTPRILLTRQSPDSTLLNAYAPAIEPEPDAQRALQMLIERRNAAEPVIAESQSDGLELRGSIQTASLGTSRNVSLTDIANLLDRTWVAVSNSQPSALQAALQQTAAQMSGPQYELLPVAARQTEFTAPDLDHVDLTMVQPVLMSNSHFAVMFQPDEGDFSPATELGKHCASMTFTLAPQLGLPADNFQSQSPMFIASL